jgi:hypothetical protein
MSDKSKPIVTAGIVLGVIYVVCAVFVVPLELFVLLLAPVLCGVWAVYLSGKTSSRTPGTGGGAKLGALTGVVGGLILVVIGAPLLHFILSSVAGDVIGERLRRWGVSLPSGQFLLILIATAIEAVIGIILATIGGLIGAAMFGKRGSHFESE